MSGGAATPVPDDSVGITSYADGVWIYGKRVKPNSVADGLSNTYLAGEKSMDSVAV